MDQRLVDQLTLAIKGALPQIQQGACLTPSLWVSEGLDGVVSLINQLANTDIHQRSTKMVLLGPIDDLPIRLQPSKYVVDQAPSEAVGAMALLEDWGVMHRCYSDQWIPGAYSGSLESLLAYFEAHHCYTLFQQLEQASVLSL